MNQAQTFRSVVYFVGAALLLLIGGGILLLALDKSVPDWVQALALADLTGLLGLLASPKGETVSIAQPADQPVPTREVT